MKGFEELENLTFENGQVKTVRKDKKRKIIPELSGEGKVTNITAHP